MVNKSEAREYIKVKGDLKRRILAHAYGRKYGSKPKILVPLHLVFKEIDQTRKSRPDTDPRTSVAEPCMALFEGFLNEWEHWFTCEFGEREPRK